MTLPVRCARARSTSRWAPAPGAGRDGGCDAPPAAVDPRRARGSTACEGNERPAGELDSWIDRRVRAVDGQEIGVVVDVVHSPVTGRPAWLLVDHGGLAAMSVLIAPVRGASLLGNDVLLAHELDVVMTATHLHVLLRLWALLQPGRTLWRIW